MENNVKNPSSRQKPDNMLVWSILSTILCCLPFGIVAIVYSNKVDTLWASGDYNGAEDAAKKAKIWMLIAVGGGVISLIIGFAFGLFAALLD